MKGLFIRGIDAELRQSLIDCGFEPVKQDVYFNGTMVTSVLADLKKYARSAQAETLGHTVGNYRYYLAPAGVIAKEELPEKWGLLEWDGKKIKMVVRAKYFKVQSEMEMLIMVSIMSRILKPQTFNFRENVEIKFVEK